jgi:2-dehydro-3-deoxyphosphogluconate aldolase/(4S)-4-hydroxy-2-oxoglutarate aldolase
MTREPDSSPETVPQGRLASALERFPVIGILRGCPSEHVVAIAAGAAEGGLTAIEVTLDSPNPLAGIRAIASELPNLVVGAGTVHGREAVQAATEAGAEFIVSPHTDAGTIAACRQAAVPALPGAATPTEIAGAMRLGAYAVKVFPAAQLGGPAFFEAVMAPLHKPPLVATGGVDATNAADYLRAGSMAVGLGSSIFKRDALQYGNGYSIKRAVADLKEALA